MLPVRISAGRLAAALGGAAILVAACSGKGPEAASTAAGGAAALDTVVVEPALVARETRFDGVIEALNQSTVAAQTTGRVVELPYDVGDYVDKGAVIVRFTAAEQRARQQALEAASSEAQARLTEAELAFDRARDVYAKRLIAKAQFDKAQSDLDAAKARAGTARAQLAEAREGLGYTTIVAPYAGIVVARHVQLGETVAPGRPIMTGLSLEHLRAVVDIPQQQIGPLRRHRQARVILPDGSSVEASELRIPPSADPATQSFRVIVELPPGDRGVYPGTLVKVAFVSGQEERLQLPAEAVVRRGELTATYVVATDGRVGLRYLRLGSTAPDGRIPVLAGLVRGERVATDPIAAGIAYKKQAAPGTGT
jgi:RND family efflux transporter MFP subunit